MRNRLEACLAKQIINQHLEVCLANRKKNQLEIYLEHQQLVSKIRLNKIQLEVCLEHQLVNLLD